MDTQIVRMANGTDIRVETLDVDQVNRIFQSQSYTGKQLLLQAVQGTPRNRLAEATGLSKHTIAKYFRVGNLGYRDCFYSLLTRNKTNVEANILEVSGLARSQAINSLMQMVQISEYSESESMRLQASREILTLAGSYKDTLAQPQSIQQMLVTISQLDQEVLPTVEVDKVPTISRQVDHEKTSSDNIPGG